MATKRTLQYLVGTIDLGINYKSNDASLTGYSDTNFANNELDCRSLTGYVFKIGNAAVTWNTRKQPMVVLSTMEAKYMAVTAATCKAIWLQQLISEPGIDTVSPTPIHIDNRAAIELTKDSKFHARAKHIDIKHHYVRNTIKDQDIVIVSCASKENLADVFTKSLPQEQHAYLIKQFGMASESRGSVVE